MKLFLCALAFVLATVGNAIGAEPNRAMQLVKFTRAVAALDPEEREGLRFLLNEAINNKMKPATLTKLNMSAPMVQFGAPAAGWRIEFHKQPTYMDCVFVAPDNRGFAFKADPHIHRVDGGKAGAHYSDWSAPSINVFTPDMWLHCTSTGGDPKNGFGLMKTAFLANGKRCQYFDQLDQPSESRGFELDASPFALVYHLQQGIRAAPNQWWLPTTNDVRDAGGLVTNHVGAAPAAVPAPTQGNCFEIYYAGADASNKASLKREVEIVTDEYLGQLALVHGQTTFAKAADERAKQLLERMKNLRAALARESEDEMHAVADVSEKQAMAMKATKNTKVASLFVALRGR